MDRYIAGERDEEQEFNVLFLSHNHLNKPFHLKLQLGAAVIYDLSVVLHFIIELLLRIAKPLIPFSGLCVMAHSGQKQQE